ncbi:hypothetical protein L0337_18960 [candidate division KSB1 bacterium]|nr:hypothetical protein [candidate division KSB1 bacterium]
MEYNLICPKCQFQHLHYLLEAEAVYTFQCPMCNKNFESRIVKIRAKRSQGSKKDNTRHFRVRVREFSGEEAFIEFDNGNYEDFELRQSDDVAFSYFKGKLRLVQNFTINRFWIVSSPRCFVASYVYGINSSEVAILRKFRDDVLLESKLLTGVVTIYYFISPRIVILLGDFHIFKVLSRAILYPIIFVLKKYFR